MITHAPAPMAAENAINWQIAGLLIEANNEARARLGLSGTLNWGAWVYRRIAHLVTPIGQRRTPTDGALLKAYTTHTGRTLDAWAKVDYLLHARIAIAQSLK